MRSTVGEAVITIAHTTDSHLGITREKIIRRMLAELAKERFDVLLHTGDYSGGVVGHRALAATVKMIREVYKGPYVSTIGNHDLWVRGARVRSVDAYDKRYHRPSMEVFEENYAAIVKCFKEHDVHFLDEDGPWRDYGATLVGHMGWYVNPAPPTNDERYLPMVNENVHRWLLGRAYGVVYDHLESLEPHETPIFVSHFPVIKPNGDVLFDFYSWSESLGINLQANWGIKKFFNGHAHQFHNGPLRYEPGSDYYLPKYALVNISA